VAAALFLMVVGGPLAMALARPWARATRTAVGAAMVLAVVLLGIFHPRFDKKLLFGGWGPFAGGYFLGRTGQTTVDVTDRYMQRLVYHREGVSAAVDVLETGWGDKIISINAQTVASTYLYDMRALRMLGHLPVLLHPNPKEALLIGLGAGVSSGIIASYPAVDHVTVVELNEEVPEGAAKFADWNFDVVHNPKVRIVINDGANYVKATHKQYDIISSDPIHPFILGNGILYSADHWEVCRDRLREGGVLAQWIPLYQLHASDFATIVRSFMEVFPNASMWYCGVDVVLIGSKGEFKVDVARMADHMSDPEITRDLLSMGVQSPGDVLGWYIAGPDQLRRMAGNAPINRVEYPVLEYSAPKALLLFGVSATMPGLLAAVDELSGLHARNVLSEMCVQPLSVQALTDAATNRLANRWIMRSQVSSSYNSPDQVLNACRRAVDLRPNDRFLRGALADALTIVADGQQNDGDSQAAYRSYLEAYGYDGRSAVALAGAAFAALQFGDLGLAESTLEMGTPAERDVFQAKVYSGLVALARSDYRTARQQFEGAASRGQESPSMHVGLGVCDLQSGERTSAYRRFDRGLKVATIPIDSLYNVVDMSLRHGLGMEVRPYAQDLVEMSTQAIADDPGEPGFYSYRALGYMVLGDQGSAEQDRQTAASLQNWWGPNEAVGGQ